MIDFLNQAIIDQIQLDYKNIPLAVFLIGTNGSGKSTLRRYLNLAEIQTNIDPDLLNRIFMAKNPNNYQICAAKHALTMYDEAIHNDLNLCLESTLSGKGTLSRILRAKQQGYFTIGYFVGLNDVELNLVRIKNRVANGGHDIPENVVRRRYIESAENLLKVHLQGCFNRLHIIDNSLDNYRLEFSIYNGQMVKHIMELSNWSAKLWDRFLC